MTRKVTDLPEGLQRAILGGRPVIVGMEDVPTAIAVLRLALACGRRDAVYLVRPGHPFVAGEIKSHHRSPQVPPDCEWHGLPYVTRSGDEAMQHVGDPAVEDAHGHHLRAWSGNSPGHGLRVAPGDGTSESSSRLGVCLPGMESDDWGDPRPVLDIAAAMAEGAVLIVDCHCSDDAPTYFLWSVLRAVQECEIRSLPLPLVASGADRLRPVSRLLGWRIVDARDMSVCVPDRDPDVFRCQADLDDALAKRVATRRRRMRKGCTDGVWWAKGEGRTVLAVHWGRRAADHEKGLDLVVAEVSPGPRITFHDLHCMPDEVAGKVADFWIHHPSLHHVERHWDSPLIRYQAEFLTTPAQAAFRTMLSGLAGEAWIPFHQAASRNDHAGALAAWVFSPGGDVTRRRQFVVAFQSLSRLAWDREVTACVDAGRSPVPRLSEIMGCPVWAIRRMGSQPYLPMGNRSHAIPEFRHAGEILRHLGHGAVPMQDDTGGWYGLVMRCVVLSSAMPHRDLDTARFARLVSGDRAVGGRPAWDGVGAGVDWPTNGNARDLRDFLAALNAWIEGVTGLANLDPLAVAVDYGSLSNLSDASRAWHRNPILRGTCRRLPHDATWTVPFGPLDLGDGWSAHPLGSMADLIAEGDTVRDRSGMVGLGHCVASYGHACATGRCLIISLRRTVENRVIRASTVELVSTPTCPGSPVGRSLSVIQHRGEHNKSPDEASVDALERMMEILAKGETVPVGKPSYLNLPGMLFQNMAGEAVAPIDLAPQWRQVLPSRWARMDIADFAPALRRDLVAVAGTVSDEGG